MASGDSGNYMLSPEYQVNTEEPTSVTTNPDLPIQVTPSPSPSLEESRNTEEPTSVTTNPDLPIQVTPSPSPSLDVPTTTPDVHEFIRICVEYGTLHIRPNGDLVQPLYSLMPGLTNREVIMEIGGQAVRTVQGPEAEIIQSADEFATAEGWGRVLGFREGSIILRLHVSTLQELQQIKQDLKNNSFQQKWSSWFVKQFGGKSPRLRKVMVKLEDMDILNNVEKFLTRGILEEAISVIHCKLHNCWYWTADHERTWNPLDSYVVQGGDKEGMRPKGDDIQTLSSIAKFDIEGACEMSLKDLGNAKLHDMALAIREKRCRICEMAGFHPERMQGLKISNNPPNLIEIALNWTDELVQDLKPIDYFLEILNLQDKYPRGIILADIIGRDDERDETGNINAFKQLPYEMLKRLLSLDYGFRDEVCAHLTKQQSSTLHKSGTTFLEAALSMQSALVKSDSTIMHPQDIFQVVYMCCSILLRQTIISKCFMCKVAVPFAIYNQQMIEIAKVAHLGTTIQWVENGRSKESDMLSHKFQIFSFIRFGIKSTIISKSQILNQLLFDDEHSAFFTRKCHLGDLDRQISSGTIESLWYLPTKNRSDFLVSPVLFANLRGSALQFLTPAKLLLDLSAVAVILLNADDIENLPSLLCSQKDYSWPNNYPYLIFLLEPGNINVQSAVQKFKGIFPDTSAYDIVPLFNIRNLAPENEKTIKKNLGDVLTRVNAQEPQFRKKNFQSHLEPVVNESSEFSTDEDHISRLIKGFENKFEQLCQNIQSTEEQYNCLQTLWRKWAKNHRSAIRLQGSGAYGRYNEIMQKARHEQIDFINIKSPAIVHTFEIFDNICAIINSTHNEEGSSNELATYVNLLDIHTAKVAHEIQPDLQNTYRDLLESIKTASKGEWKRLEDLMAKASLSGTQQFLRDLGQMYSCLKANPDDITNIRKKDFEQFPDIVAELVVSGATLEIMDGDAFSVPLEWMHAVFQSLNQKLDKKKLLVISVVGVQSSGKSTLLNAMFGVQFAVSAGRCTRGVYAKLLKIDIPDLGYDYMMVVDTEGLRAMSVEENTHDNELATLAIGMGDLTIINIKGENYTDMRDILQITVHAFLRLKLVNQHQHNQRRCMFVHQNVAAPDASDKMMIDRSALQKALNKATKEAAELEQVFKLTKFDEIMEFDWKYDVFQFSDLWKGDPPMAPANPGYSRGISKMKKRLFMLSKGKQYYAVDYLQYRIRDLWEGILSDNFVFRFRNSLEISAHHALDRKTYSLSMKLYDKCESLAKERAYEELVKCKTREKIIEVSSLIYKNIMSELEKNMEEYEVELQEFCDEHPFLQCIPPDWKKSELFKVRKTVSEIIEKEKTNRIFYVELEGVNGPIIKLLQMKAKDLGRRLNVQGKGFPKNVLHTEFDEFWQQTLEETIEPTQKESLESIKSEVENVLHSCFKGNDEKELKAQLKSHPLTCLPDLCKIQGTYGTNHLPKLDPQKDIVLKKESRGIDENMLKEAGHVIEESLLSVDKQVDEIMKSEMKSALWFLETNSVISSIRDTLDRHNCHSRNRYIFTPRCKLRLCIYACSFAMTKFHEKARQISDKYGKKAIMNNFRNTLFVYFESIVMGIKDWELMTKIVCEMLETSSKETITSALLDHFITEREVRYEKRCGLKLEVIERLLTKDDFASFIKFIHKPQDAASDILENEINGFYEETVMIIVPQVVNRFEQVLSDMNSGEQKGGRKLFSKWIASFKSLCKKAGLHTSDQIFEQLNDEIDESKFTCEIVQKAKGLEQNLKTYFLDVADVLQKSIASKLLGRFWGCDAVCPFCNTPCTRLNNSTHFGKHESHVQRPLSLFGICRGSLENPLYNHNCVGLQKPKHRQRNIPLVRLIPSDDGSEADCCVHAYEDDDHDDWDIRGFEHYKMWNWLLYKYKDDIQNYYGHALQVDDAWNYKQHEIDSFIENLSVMSYMKDTI